MSEQHPTNPSPTPTSPTPGTPDPAATSVDPAQAPAAPGSVLGEPPKEPDGNEPAPEPFDAEKLALPEGFEKTEHFDQFIELAKAEGLKQPTAQKLVELSQNLQKAAAEKQWNDWKETNTKWVDEVKADKEIGGTNLDSVKQTVAKLLDNPEMSDPKFREVLDFTGAGNNPAVIRTLYRWAKALGEGSAVSGEPAARGKDGAVTNEPKSLATSLYGPSGPHSGGPKL